MSHEIYAFGSITRGEITNNSDTDILVIPLSGQQREEYPLNWSYYQERTLKTMFEKGQLFAWHLFLDSICLFTSREKPLLVEWGKPSKYKSVVEDILELNQLLKDSLELLKMNSVNQVFEIGIIHTCLRDIAMSASFILCHRPSFSIYSPYNIGIFFDFDINLYKKCIEARHYSTRGIYCEYNWEYLSKKLLESSILDWVVEVLEVLNEYVFE